MSSIEAPATLPQAPTEVSRAYGARRAGKGSLLVLLLLSLGHMAVDLYSSALGALQPLLVSHFGLSLTQAGFLGGLLVFSAVTQPFYGIWSDRWRTRMFAALGPAIAAIFISALGLAPSYGWLLAMVWLGGAGIAMFHPQATARATEGLEEHRGRAMALFVSAGTLGFALGPTFFTLITQRVGLEGAWIAALPGISVSGFLLWALPPAPGEGSGRSFQLAPLRAVAKPLTILYILVFIRSAIQLTYAQMLPLYLSLERGFAVDNASYMLSLYIGGGAIGGLLGGHLADRIGGRNVILLSMVGSVPLLALFFVLDGWVAMASLILGGAILLFTVPVNVVIAQELAPRQAGTVSALMMGFAWGTAGIIFLPLTGWLSDLYSMHVALASLLLCPIVGIYFSLRLPR